MDILWRRNDRNMYVWHMNGKQFIESEYYGQAASEYQILNETLHHKFLDDVPAGSWGAVVSTWNPIR